MSARRSGQLMFFAQPLPDEKAALRMRFGSSSRQDLR
jgi:hypothetical protein